MRIKSNRTLWFLALGTVLACSLIALYGSSHFSRIFIAEAAARGQNTLRLAIAILEGELARYEKLPELVADDEDIRALVRDPGDSSRIEQANAYLKSINTLLESSDIYVMVPDGTTIAASNADTDTSFVGENFQYRPYFRDALDGGIGRFFALGTTSLKRGYYFGAPVWVDDAIAGVVVFKLDLDSIEQTWRGADYEIIVTDPEGIIFMTGRPEWMYKGLLTLSPDRLSRTAATRRYADAILQDLPVQRTAYDDDLELMSISSDDATREYLVVAQEMPEAEWTVKVLLDTASARGQAVISTIAAVLIVVLGAMATAIYLQRRARLSYRLQVQKDAQEQLERRVAERTNDLASLNRQLEREVAERRSTEVQLRRTQSDLVQAGKLAALGQMSAALSHEFNQPLGAAKNYADNARILIERDRIPEASENIARISSLIDRMASISRHLRNFSRKPHQKLRPVLLSDVLDDTQEIVAWRLAAAKAELDIELGATPLAVMAGSVRLQQVLVNIISNAADAVDGFGNRTIKIRAEREDHQVLLHIRDHGPGIGEDIAGRIFDPFFSTKGVGKGLGLGLSISYNIIKDFGGSLSAQNHPDGGAEFTIALDATEMPAHAILETFQ
ncbi:two-component system, NtrC family, C4-dicarboxylate transport sensor histidine kinase DctB [Devosia crocina]|uniref:C4-dicarboxylate transport sensor protein DctB n=1 Tax=Devosia crocina TaxID=429728 RepID=A0A1I7NKJ7_9HYPH|nr:sensor histidine kinase [Devosia crocina]SFV35192.1 two-component system, NtrC family, C4-dicarboxylate transport sensor histidine kinase DctB [Devosia crocina]